jgi:hypothetical protein
MLRPKARGPRWFGDQLRSRSSSLSASAVVLAVRAVVVVVVDALSSSSGFDGVPGLAVGPEMTLDRRCRGSNSLPAPLVLGRRQIQAVGGRRSSPPALRALARGGALRLLCYRSFEQCLQLLANPSLLGSYWLRAITLQHGRSGKVMGRPPKRWRCVGVSIASTFAPSLAHRLLLGFGPRAGGVDARSCDWSTTGRRSC